MDGSDPDRFVWKVRKDTVDKVLQYLEHPVRDNCLLTHNDGEHLMVRYSSFFLLE